MKQWITAVEKKAKMWNPMILKQRLNVSKTAHTRNESIRMSYSQLQIQSIPLTPVRQRFKFRVCILGRNLIASYLKHRTGDQLQPTSDISSLEGSSGDETPRLTSLSPPRKRKRLSSDEDHSIRGQSPANKILNKSPSTGSLSPVVTPIDERSPSEEVLIADNPIEREDIHAGDVANKQQKRKTGARKARKSPTRDLTQAPEAPASLEDTGVAIANGDAVSSNGEDGEGDDGVDADVENAGKSEEGGKLRHVFTPEALLNAAAVLKKRSALDSLTALEKCFATLRDKYVDLCMATNEC